MKKFGTRAGLVLATLAAALIFAPPVRASDTWVLCFRTNANHYQGEPDCESLAWRDMLFLFNANSTAATVRILGISNLPLYPTAQEISIPPKSLLARSLVPIASEPCLDFCAVTLFVAYLDIPEGVFVSSRAQVLALVEGACPHPPEVKPRVLAGLPLPVKRDLTPAGVAQYHLGIDTGSDEFAGDSATSASARTSIGIYNQAAVTANASVEIRRGIDDCLMERRAVTVPPNSLIQFGGFAWDTSTTSTPACGPLIPKAPGYAVYAVVTADQPSFSYAISLRNDMPPKFVGTAPVTQ